MDAPDRDPLAAVRARWFPRSPHDPPPPRDGDCVARAHDDIALLMAEVQRLRTHLDALTPPPKVGIEDVPACCERLARYLADPDNVVDYWAEGDQFLLPVRGSSRSGITIAFCPWCGSPLPVVNEGEASRDARPE